MYHPITDSQHDLLAEWRWMIGGHARAVGWSSAGDLFYSDERDQIWHLDTGAGTAEPVAESPSEFELVLVDATRSEDLFLLPVVRAYEAAHGRLTAGQCLGFTTLPVFGGPYSAHNRYAITIAEHVSFTGDLHRQIHDLPDGTAVKIKVVP